MDYLNRNQDDRYSNDNERNRRSNNEYGRNYGRDNYDNYSQNQRWRDEPEGYNQERFGSSNWRNENMNDRSSYGDRSNEGGFGDNRSTRWNNQGYDDWNRDYQSNRNYQNNRGGNWGNPGNYNEQSFDWDRGYGNRNSGDYGSRSGYGNFGADRGFSRDRDYNNNYNRGNRYDYDDRDWWDKTKDEVSSWFGDDDAERRRRIDKMQEGQHRGKGPKGYKRSDGRIQEDINDRLNDDPYLDASNIEVSVSNGEVTLTGTVEDRNSKRRAEDLSDSISGVTHVQNNLRVSNKQHSWNNPGTSTGTEQEIGNVSSSVSNNTGNTSASKNVHNGQHKTKV